MTGVKPCTVCLTFDFDALCGWLRGSSTATPAQLSRGEYGARVGVPRILKLLEAHDISATFFVPGHTVESFPDVVEAILAAGHELAHHGYGHEFPSTQSPGEERRSMEKGLAALAQFMDAPPLGYRSPAWDHSANTLPLLLEYGFLYDSSLFAADFQPYRPRLGDLVTVEEPLQLGQEVDLWEFPVDFCLDDWPHFPAFFQPGISAPSKVLEIWTKEFDFMVEQERSGVFTLTMHPQVIGRGHRIRLLDQLVQHIVSTSSARFARMGDVARELSKASNAQQ